MCISPFFKALVFWFSKIRRKRGEEKGNGGKGREGIKERWKQRLAGAGQGFLFVEATLYYL